MSDPFTIRIFVPDGDPEGVRIIDRMNWTGLGLVFPRSKWTEVRSRPEIERTGIYILVGYGAQNDELPTLYIGQADGVRSRIDSHHANKDFWNWSVVFVSNSSGLNRAHVTWLEHALIRRATDAKRCYLDNGNAPQEPAMSEAEKADTRAFLKEILQILPLVGLRAFEVPKPVATPQLLASISKVKQSDLKPDTIIVPALKEGFEKVFLGADCWYAVRISGGMLDKIKYIAGYQTQPISAITHYAAVERIEPYGEEGKYRLVFAEKAKPVGPIPFADSPQGTMQGPRYTRLDKLHAAKKVSDLLK
jgi:hypothetical protein